MVQMSEQEQLIEEALMKVTSSSDHNDISQSNHEYIRYYYLTMKLSGVEVSMPVYQVTELDCQMGKIHSKFIFSESK